MGSTAVSLKGAPEHPPPERRLNRQPEHASDEPTRQPGKLRRETLVEAGRHGGQYLSETVVSPRSFSLEAVIASPMRAEVGQQ
jgi:hypothetical protein